MTEKRKAVFLDRDGVLVRSEVRGGKPYAALTLSAFEILPEAPGAVRALKAAGFVTVLVTNQPELARGNLDPVTMEAMHATLGAALPLDDVRICPHDGDTGCACRKPAPGMLLDAAKALGLDLEQSFMVGDRWRDVGAGRAAGCRTILIDRGYDEPEREIPDFTVRDVAEAAGVIVAHAGRPSA
ncbi:HAD-IIIA family hydrolase [Thalassobaculum sp. OXR-137]|uniref:D-glycero-alpha-D-manno-heptose-1,7-bisphosphate 7-phosphatase n=1 Tax=Thalassobaculum sp. OXR-137 TaxID=3100173 RepID=UPI002AC921B5|nr:HAD-IIIA family hydrolase [Thalassobaculum sp. OXR-137]WPZ36205.1 HAD-IIIA family hydrolase [Thalassobaculum sp. OXR-137]